MDSQGTPSARSGEAVVIGASMAGLLAARALTDSFARVTVVDRDEMPVNPAHRRGVPQSQHAHGLLARGREILEELLPGLTDDLVGRGAVLEDLQGDVAWFNDGVQLAPARSGMYALSLSRALLEWYVRQRVAELPGVVVVPGCEAVELVAGGSRITGVKLRHLADGREELATADLVVDASGRGNRGPTWLRSLGYAAPTEESVAAGISYVSRDYRRKPDDYEGTGVVIGMAGDNPTGGVALAVDDDRWMVTLMGMGDDVAPMDDAGYEAFAARLPVPDLHHIIQRAEPLGPPLRMRLPTSVRRRYDKLRRLPANFIAIGDALCFLNPAYGQGMAVAATEALALRDCLAAGRPGLPRRYFRATARLIDVAWSMAVTADLRFPTVAGERTRQVRFLNWYIKRLHRVAHRRPAVGLAFLRVANLMDGPQRLFAPRIAVRVLLARTPQPR